jgi:putative FmdB family regulatory protein
MPLYEYACRSCGHRFEVIQRLAEEPLTSCAKCQGEVDRLLSSPAIQFKGSGWYVTDYARKGGPSAEKSGEGEAKKEKPSPDKSSEKASEKSSTTTAGPSQD